MYYPNKLYISWISTVIYHAVTASVFLAAFVLKIIKALKLRSETKLSHSDVAPEPNTEKKNLFAKIPKIFAIIGSVMFVFAVDYLTWAIFNSEADIPFSLSYFTIWIIYKTYLAVMGFSILTAIVLGIVSLIINRVTRRSM